MALTEEEMKEFSNEISDNYFSIFSTEKYELIKFKTGGMRGIMGPGLDKINNVTCNLLATSLEKRFNSFVIGFDHRKNSRMFAQIFYRIFNIHNKPVAAFQECVTPYLAFESNKFDVGVMITASHNTKEYNGVKVYIKGAQIPQNFIKEIESDMRGFLYTKLNSSDLKDGLIEEVIFPINFKSYFDSFKINPMIHKNDNIKIFFSSLSGISAKFIDKANEYFGTKINIDLKENQPDPEFNSFPYPNPEVIENHSKVFQSILNLNTKYIDLKESRINYLFMCDPDGDRFSLSRFSSTSFKIYNGDEIAQIFAYWVLKNYKKEKICFINTFLCNGFLKAASLKHGILYKQTETGFKHISAAVKEAIREKSDIGIMDPAIFAYEDSLGYLIINGGEKDGIKSAVVMFQILNEYTPEEILENLEEYGSFNSYNFQLRVSNPKDQLKILLNNAQEYEIQNDRFVINKENFKITLRISGTESLIKIYSNSNKLSQEDLKKEVEKLFENK